MPLSDKKNREDKKMKQVHQKVGFMLLTVFFVMFSASAWAAKDTLVVVNNIDSGSLDPISTRDIAASTICAHIYDNLVKLDTQNNLFAGLGRELGGKYADRGDVPPA
jgi:hypothetical protein